MWNRQYKNKWNKNEDASSKYDENEIVQITVLMEFKKKKKFSETSWISVGFSVVCPNQTVF